MGLCIGLCVHGCVIVYIRECVWREEVTVMPKDFCGEQRCLVLCDLKYVQAFLCVPLCEGGCLGLFCMYPRDHE